MIVMLLLIVISAVFAEDEFDSSFVELTDPDEAQVLEYWLEQFFGAEGPSTGKSASIVRQRLIYSSTEGDWGYLTKSRIGRGNTWIYGLMEQDIGDPTLNDHAVLSLEINPDKIPGTFLIGAYDLRWGGGFLNNQAQQRRSLSVGSLDRSFPLRIRPHYSTIETGYFRGVAYRYGDQRLSLNAYRSFLPLGAGTALKYRWAGLSLYLAYQSREGDEDRWEWGLQMQDKQPLSWSVAGDGWGNIKLSAAYRRRPYAFSAQVWSYQNKRQLPNAGAFRLLPSSSQNEIGFSQRGMVKLWQRLRIQWAVDQGHNAPQSSLSGTVRVRRMDALISYRGKLAQLTGEMGRHWEDQTGSDGRWDPSPQSTDQNNFGMRFTHRLSEGFHYESVIRSRFSGEGKGLMVQQKLKLQKEDLDLHLGWSRYTIDDSSLRISIYESAIQEGYGFFTAYSDGHRYFGYVRLRRNSQQSYEFRVTHSQRILEGEVLDNLTAQFQLSVVF